ncbi:MAG: methylenetetrahydrofolate reductase C-terminal domain-containing protein, partial [Methanosarcinaceae archaeon]|nr:methylenetetrahydrofolate reductase C-terminal domain-containing protein [Methanosarcinaceae archaeon]
MIITSAKPFEEVLALLKDEDDIFIVGCNVCAAKLKTGGEPEVLCMEARLKASGKRVVGWALPTAACSVRSYESLVEKNAAIKNAHCVLVMGCGSGISTVAKLVNLPVYGSNNTLSLGGKSEGQLLSELCVLCGTCTIWEFGGICPKARCPKGLLNGPCGGAVDGKCEVD